MEDDHGMDLMDLDFIFKDAQMMAERLDVSFPEAVAALGVATKIRRTRIMETAVLRIDQRMSEVVEALYDVARGEPSPRVSTPQVLSGGMAWIQRVKVTEYTKGQESDRLVRLGRLVEFLTSIDKDGHRLTIAAIHDHKGTLQVSWVQEPSRQARGLVEAGWSYLGEDEVEHVVTD